MGEFVQDEASRELLQRDYLRVMPDLHRICKRFIKNVASLEDVVRVYQVAVKIEGMIDALALDDPSGGSVSDLRKRTYIAPLTEHRDILSKYQEMVETTIDLDQTSQHTFVIRSEYSPQLEDYRNQLNVIVQSLDQLYQSVADDLGLECGKKLHLEKHLSYGYCLRVTKAVRQHT